MIYIKNHDINIDINIIKKLVIFTELLVLFSVIGSSISVAYAGFSEENKPMEQKIYVSNNGDGTISVINMANNTVIDTIQAGVGAYDIAISPDHTKAYVDHCCGFNYTWIIDTKTNQRIANISLPEWSLSHEIAIKPDGTKYYITSSRGNPHGVWVFNTTNNELINTITVGNGSFGIVISPDGTRAYVTNWEDNTVSVVDTVKEKEVAIIPLNSPSSIVVNDIQVSPDNKTIYVTGNNTDVWVIDTASGNVKATISVGDYLHGVAVSPDGKKVYVAKNNDLDKGNVSVINTTTNEVITNISVGKLPCWIVFTPDGTTAYVTNSNSNTVSVIDVAKDIVIATVPVGSYPEGIAVIPAIQIPALNITKSATTNNPSDPTTYNTAGQQITYTYNVTNTGKVAITGPINVSDNITGTTNIPNSSSLPVDASVKATATYVVTQQDVDNGSVTNLAYATGSYKEQFVLSNNTSVMVPAIQNPALKIDKDVDPKTYFAVGDLIDYSYTVTNKGNVDIAGPITVKDSMFGSAKISSSGLASGQSITKGNSYLITPYDIDTGFVINSAFAKGSFKDKEVTSNTDKAIAKFFGPTTNLFSS